MKTLLNLAVAGLLLAGTMAAPAQSTNAPAWGAGPHILLVGGGKYHDFPRWFDATDSATLRDAGFAVRYATDPNQAADWLPEADVLVFSAVIGWPVTQKFEAAFLKHRQAGKGIVALHTGVWVSWPAWPEVNRGFGLASRSHPPLFNFAIHNLHVDHPLSALLPNDLPLTDELYSVQPFPGGAPVTVLAETDVSPQTHKKHPSFWVVNEPGVRVACIAPGHDGRTHTNEVFKKWLVGTVRWAATPAGPGK